MFNSREYQDQREDLYLAALPVTQERFSFTAQFFAAQDAIRALLRPRDPGQAAKQLDAEQRHRLQQDSAHRRLLLLNFSNQTVFNFLNPKDPTSVTTLDFNAIQPLLRAAARR